jgi:hypothetical protein
MWYELNFQILFTWIPCLTLNILPQIDIKIPIERSKDLAKPLCPAENKAYLSYLYRLHCLKSYFICNLYLPEGQAGSAWEPSKSAIYLSPHVNRSFTLLSYILFSLSFLIFLKYVFQNISELIIAKQSIQ